METAQINYSSSFSWHRVGMIARYYYPALKWQMIIYPIVSALFGIITYLASRGNLDLATIGLFSVLVMTVVGFTQPFMLYFAPGFLVRSCRDVDVAIPALSSEKATFIMLYLFVVVPAMLYLPGVICSALTQLIVDPSSFDVAWIGLISEESSVNAPFSLMVGSSSNAISLTSIASFLPLSVFAFVLFRAPKPSFGKSALFSIIALVASSMIMGIVLSISVIRDAVGEGFESVGVGFGDMNGYMLGYALICGLISVVFMWLTVRSFNKIQL